MTKCNICNELSYRSALPDDSRYTSIVRSGHTRIAETEHLVVLPSVGPIDSCHAMIAPRKHINSFAQLPSNISNSVRLLMRQMRDFVKKEHSKELVFFESGAGTLSGHAGGCIIHAHIHAVSYCKDFEERLFGEVAMQLQLADESLTSADTKFGYVWYMDPDEREYICNRPMLPSQFLRYLYTQTCSNERMWNWRRHPNVDGIFDVLRNYQKFSK